MITYKKIAELAARFISKPKVLKFGFNLSPMYRRTSAKVIYISEDFLKIQIKLPFSYKNANYVNTIFGGSMFSAVDPFPMTQLMNLIGDDYVVWDKAAEIFFRRPAKEDLYADFIYSLEELEEIKKKAKELNEFEIVKDEIVMLLILVTFVVKTTTSPFPTILSLSVTISEWVTTSIIEL